MSGTAQFVLPEYQDLPYINIRENNHYGLIDIVGSAKQNGFDVHNWYDNYFKLKRHFSIKAKVGCEVLHLDVHKIKSMGEVFPKDFDRIFGQIGVRFERSIK